VDAQRATAVTPAGSRIASRIAWPLCGLILALIACAVALSVLNRYDGPLTFLFAVATAALVGGLVASRKPANPVGWIIAGHALCFALGEFARQYSIYGVLTAPGSLAFARAMAWPTYWVWFPGVMLLVSFLPLYFPSGRLVSRRWRPVVFFAVSITVATGGIAAIRPSDEETPGIPNPLGIEGLNEGLRSFSVALDDVMPGSWLALGVASAVSLVVRFRRSRGEERQQIKWVAYAVVFLIFYLLMDVLFVRALAPAVSRVLGDVLLVAPWLAIAVAILKHRLYDIDLIINRTLVYGALTACVVGIYVLVVGYLGAAFRVEENLIISLLATGIVAVLFASLRDRLQRAANRLMYGERDDPYAVLSRLGQRLEATLDPRAVLPTIVETVVGALKVPHAEVSLEREDGFETVAARGAPVGDPLMVPLVYQNETVGRLTVSPRAKGEPFAPADERLLEDLARQAGVAAYAVRLTADLQRSRERLVAAREEERRRLRRDLHDGVGPQLAALTLKIETARNKLGGDPGARDLLSDLADRARAAVADVRRSVHALRPPALDELGLLPALRETAAQYGQAGLRVRVEAPEGGTLPPLPAAVEVAAYRIAQEAMTNVVRHAGASSCVVRFGPDGGAGLLRLEVEDDGRGIGGTRDAGVGLSSMRERAEELGGTCVFEALPTGGTRVRAELPLPEETKDDT